MAFKRSLVHSGKLRLDQKIIGLLLLAVILGFGGGYLLYSRLQPSASPQPAKLQPPDQTPVLTQNLTQKAYVQGNIVKASSDMLTVVTDKNQTIDFQISPKMIVYLPTDNPRQGTASSDYKKIILNKPALVDLQLIDNKYQVVDISYIPAPPSK